MMLYQKNVLVNIEQLEKLEFVKVVLARERPKAPLVRGAGKNL